MKYYFLYFLLFVFFLPTSFAKVNVEEVKSALILCNNDVILKQHDETANVLHRRQWRGYRIIPTEIF